MKKFCFFLITAFCLFLGACASEEVQDNANPYADIQEGFMAAQDPRTYHESQTPPDQFFYKQCDQHPGTAYYSKTSYFCNDH